MREHLCSPRVRPIKIENGSNGSNETLRPPRLAVVTGNKGASTVGDDQSTSVIPALARLRLIISLPQCFAPNIA
jgi:hypothetical protein